MQHGADQESPSQRGMPAPLDQRSDKGAAEDADRHCVAVETLDEVPVRLVDHLLQAHELGDGHGVHFGFPLLQLLPEGLVVGRPEGFGLFAVRRRPVGHRLRDHSHRPLFPVLQQTERDGEPAVLETELVIDEVVAEEFGEELQQSVQVDGEDAGHLAHCGAPPRERLHHELDAFPRLLDDGPSKEIAPFPAQRHSDFLFRCKIQQQSCTVVSLSHDGVVQKRPLSPRLLEERPTELGDQPAEEDPISGLKT